MLQLKDATRHKCFISYHHDDEDEVSEFIENFDHTHDIIIARGIGASMPGDVVNSNDSEYIMSRIRTLYMNPTSVTIVMIGRCTWSRRFVDWEIAASLRNTVNTTRNGLIAITLPSISSYSGRQLPPRLKDNVTGSDGYARWYKYPNGTEDLANMIDMAFSYRISRAELADNRRQLFGYNRNCS